jgi:Alpha-L-fucosidase./Beta-galactosidase trimerisation domain.
MGNLRFRQVHLDFHTSEKIVSVGEKFNARDFAQTLADAGVNSITCFARCHHGMIYYDTRFPNKHPGVKINLLKEQIDACHALNIKVPIYITVGWDEYSATNHPEWIERMPDGKPYGAGPLNAGWRTLCFNTPYIDYVEEQTVEVLEKFGSEVDGIFFDIIFQDPCCCSYCMKDMLAAGMDPEKEDERKKFAEQVLNRFKRRLTETIRKYNSSCTIFYNAGHVNPEIHESLDTYTHLELESLPSGGWGYDHFPITVKYARLLGKEYLGMTGKFHKSWADFGGFKNQAALEYECFMSLANGAGISIGDQLHPNGEINKATYELIGSVYNQVKLKEEWCADTKPVSEIAVYNPEAINKSDRRLDPAIRGAYHMLTEAKYQFDIVDSVNDFSSYKVIILPDNITIDDKLKDKLNTFKKNGGCILLSYKSGMDAEGKQFVLPGLGIEFVEEAQYSPDYIKALKPVEKGLMKTEYVMYDKGLWVKPLNGTETLADIWNPYFNRNYKHFCSHFQTPVDKASGYPAVTKNDGMIYFSHPVFSMYYKHGYRAYKQLVINCLELLIKNKLIITNAPTTAHMYLNQQTDRKRYVAHILHYIPERRSEAIDTIEDVIPLFNVGLKVGLPQKPEKVYLAPSMKPLDFVFEDGYASVVVPEVRGHEMVVFE